MKKETKKMLIKHGYSLYQKKWIEKAATEGCEQVMKNLKEREPQLAEAMSRVQWIYEIVYYTAFEDALNTFLLKVLEDDFHKVELCVNELSKVTAMIIENGKR